MSHTALARTTLILATAFAAGACGQRNQYAAPAPPKVIVATPVAQDVTPYFQATGNTAAFNSVTLVARVQGYLESIDYKDGAAVVKGTQLFRIESDVYQAQLDQAKGQLAHDQALLAEAQVDLTRYQTLQRQNSIAGQQAEDQAYVVQQDRGTVMVDQANVETATINLGFTSVIAPFDGIVTNHQVSVGTLVGQASTPPTTLATIVQLDPIYVTFTVSESDVLQARAALKQRGQTSADLIGMPVEVALQNETDYPHVGKLDYVAPSVDPSTGTLAARAILDNGDHALLPGYFVRVRIPLRPRPALLVPDAALGSDQRGRYVLVVNANNVVEQRTVSAGQLFGNLRVIESGLAKDDRVVVGGIMRAIPGQKVDPELASAAAAK